MRLTFQVDAAGKLPVKVIARTFASGKTEKAVYQAFADLGLPSEKVRREARVSTPCQFNTGRSANLRRRTNRQVSRAMTRARVIVLTRVTFTSRGARRQFDFYVNPMHICVFSGRRHGKGGLHVRKVLRPLP